MSRVIDMYRRGNTIKHIIKTAHKGKPKEKIKDTTKEVYTEILQHYYSAAKEWSKK